MVNILSAAREGKLRLFQSVTILVLAGLLIFYHFHTLTELYLGDGTSTNTTYEYIQSVLRFAIAVSLLFVVFGKKRALWTMWFSISCLVATHYWAHFGNLPVDFTEGRHPLSYLKGFIFPTIITAAFLYKRPEKIRLAE